MVSTVCVHLYLAYCSRFYEQSGAIVLRRRECEHGLYFSPPSTLRLEGGGGGGRCEAVVRTRDYFDVAVPRFLLVLVLGVCARSGRRKREIPGLARLLSLPDER